MNLKSLQRKHKCITFHVDGIIMLKTQLYDVKMADNMAAKMYLTNLYMSTWEILNMSGHLESFITFTNTQYIPYHFNELMMLKIQYGCQDGG